MIKKIMAMLVVICSVSMVKSAQTPPNQTLQPLQNPPNQIELYNAARQEGLERRRVAAAQEPQAPGIRLFFDEEPEDEVENPLKDIISEENQAR